ncbi:autotransporter domain-containing protein [Phascolarctobacterium faecium]|uniref:autotransporter domain-containing protein n=1 Tax=Phascolarctobacterium faecium TaxID=33025 RepID=UPI003AB6A9D0
MLRNGAREKALSRKVMLSLLMAGTMSVCISGGDVWAENTVKLTSDTVYNVIGEIPTSIEMNGHNIISNVMLNADNAGLNIIGTDMENLTINGEGLQFAVAAQSSSNAKVLISNVKKVDITGNVINDSLLHSNINGAIIFDKVGLFNITTEKSIGLHAQGGLIYIDADAVSIKSKDENAIWAQLSNCSGDYPSDVKIKSSGDITLQSTSSTAVGAVNMDSNVTDNKVTVDLQGKNIYVISEKSTGLLSNDFQTGKTSIILNADDVVNIKAGKNGIYAANGRDKGDAFVSVDAGKEINITGVQNAIYAGSNALVKINDRGMAKVSLTGNVVAENGGQIIVKNADQIGALKVDGGIYNGNNISIKYSAPTLDDRTAVYVANNGSAVFDGDKTEIIINSQSENDPRGVWVTSGGKVEFNAKETVIDVTGVGGSSKWGFGLLLNGTVGGSAVFNGQNVAIKNYQDHYTSQTVTAKTGSEITFNNIGNVLISAKSPFGVTAVDNQGNITFHNSGNVDIVGTIVPGNKSAQTNVVGIQSGSSGAETVVTDKVKDFNITLSGAGVDNDGTSYSTGTYGIILDKDVKALINSATLNIKMNIADNVEDISPGDHTTEEAYGIDPDGGYITVGTGTVTNITIQEGLGTAYAVNAASATSVVELLGDTTIVAAGKTASYALNAEADGQITVGSTGKTVHLTGDIVAKNDGVINIAGKTNTINGIVKAVDGGTVNLSGASDAVYNNININSFVTQGTGSNGSVKLNGGTMDFGTLNNQNLASNSFVVNGGSLKAASKDIFTSGLTAAGTAIDSGDVLSVVNNAVKFESGKLILSDEKYNLAWLKTAKAALNNADSGTMGLVVTGTLVTTDGKIQTEASASDLADTGAVHAGVTGKVDTNDVTIGSSGLENLGVKDLALGGSAADASKVTVGDGKELTLVGSGSENDALVKTSGGTAKTNVAVAVGDGTNAGTLNLGVAGTASGGNLNAAVAIANDDSKVNVDAGTFKVNEISADKGTINVNEGAALKTDSLTVGSSGSTVKLSGTGALEAQSMTVSTGTIEVTGTAKAGNLTVNDSNAIISVGTGNSAGSLVAGNADLNGAAVVLDPVWQGNDTIGNASKAALAFTNNNVNGLMTVGRNSVLSLGTDDTGKAEQAFAESELTWGKTGVSAALYIDQAQKLQVQGGILLDGTKTAASAEANKASFADGSLLIVNGSGIGTSGTAALTGGSGSTLTVNQGAKLYLTSTNAGTYTIAKGFANTTIDGWSWSADAAAVDVSVNKLSEIEKIEKNTADGDFTVTVRQTDVQKKYDGIALPNILQAMDQSRTEYAGIKYLTDLANDNKLDKEGFIAAVNSFAQGAENSGATRTGALAALDLGTAVQEHLSLAKAAAEQSGGFGKAAVDTADNGGIWAQYIHNKDKVDNMGGVSYDGQYNGVIIGGDFADRGKYSSGIAFSYGSGDSTGSASKNEFDFWGLSYYGGIQNGDTNLIFDVGYSKTSSDVKGVIKAEPDTQVISMGIKGEKVISNGHGTSYVPYAGLRYMNIDTDSYNGSIDGKTAAHYSTDKADLWLLPVGISISHESVTAGGWKVRPTADIAYVWTLGDKNTAMDITVPGVNATDRLGYDIMDSGFFVGKLGLEAEKGDWTYGLGYACQKGSHAHNRNFRLNVTYSF